MPVTAAVAKLHFNTLRRDSFVVMNLKSNLEPMARKSIFIALPFC
jgi:hypothetical protein